MFCDPLNHPNLHLTSNTVPTGKETSEVFAMILSSERLGAGHEITGAEIKSIYLRQSSNYKISKNTDPYKGYSLTCSVEVRCCVLPAL